MEPSRPGFRISVLNAKPKEGGFQQWKKSQTLIGVLKLSFLDLVFSLFSPRFIYSCIERFLLVGFLLLMFLLLETAYSDSC